MRQKGVALLVVVMVLAALAAIALPFSVSMTQHLRAMRVHSAETAARLAAEGALAHAAAVLYRTQDSTEEESLLGKKGAYGPPWNTPEYDSVDELETSPKRTLEGGTLAALKEKGVSFSDSRGTIWSARVEDEQGKINVLSVSPELLGGLIGATVLTAPLDEHGMTLYVEDASRFFSDDDPATVDGRLRVGVEVMEYFSAEGDTISVRRFAGGASRHRRGSVVYPAEAYDVFARAMSAEEGAEPPLLTLRSLKGLLSPEQFDAMERYITVWSYRSSASGWIRKEEVKSDYFDSSARRVLVEDASNYGRGAYARISLGGRVQCVRKVSTPSLRRGRYDAISFEQELGFVKTKTDEVWVELLQRHPVNVNTAPTSVLVYVFQGVSATGSDYVSKGEAESLADYILSLDEPIKGEADLREVMDAAREGGIISRADAKALIENALVQSSHNLRHSTTTFCYKSYGNFTVEATGLVNTPAGAPLASHTLREVISIPPTASGVYALVTQKDFDLAMRTGPGSKKVATWPNALSDRENYEADDTVTETDEYGDVRIESARMAAPSGGKIEHFEQKKGVYDINPDGLDLRKGGSMTLDADSGFKKTGRNVEPGAFSMWFLPAVVGGRRCLFDIGQDESQNRVSLYHDANAGGFVLRVCGPEKVPPWAVAPEFHLPWDVDAGTWYHVAASWKGTLPSQASIRVDGRPKHMADPFYLPASTLVGDLTRDADSVTVADVSYFPEKGVVRIGDEIIEYESRGTSSLDDCRRGQRYSYKSEHKSGEVVYPYGYSNELAHDLFTGGASLAEYLPASASTGINASGGVKVEKTDTEIPVISTGEFQKSGFLRISNDIIYYGSKSGDSFKDCSLHLHPPGQASGTYSNGTSVRQASIRTDKLGSYKQGGGDAYASIQVEAGPVEWIHIGKTDSRDGMYYIVPQFAYDSDGHLYYAGGWRGRFGTSARSHEDGEMVVPVVRMKWPRCGNYEPKTTEDKTSDEVTVVDSDGSEEAEIRRSYARSYWVKDDDHRDGGYWVHEYLACLDRFLGRMYEDGKGARIVKFPSGELPTSLPTRVTVGSADGGSDPIFSVIDEVGFGTGRHSAAMAEPDAGGIFESEDDAPGDIGAGEDTIVACPDIFSSSGTSAPDLPSNGAVRLGGELLHFESKSSESLKIRWHHNPDKNDYGTSALVPPEKTISCLTLEDCTRGVLGAANAAHDAGSGLVALDDYPLTVLDAGGSLSDDEAKVKNAANFPDEGYLFFPETGEVMGWTLRQGTTLRGCEDLRGCFGTAPVSHASGELALAVPFRYWSRFIPCSDSPAWCCYQFSCTRLGAVWRSIVWEEADYTGLGGPEGARPVFFVRFGGAPEWDEEPAQRPGSIWMFVGGGEHSFGAVQADQIEVRMGFSHLTNAFRRDGNSSEWKTTPMVKNVMVTYFMSPVVRERDELDSP